MLIAKFISNDLLLPDSLCGQIHGCVISKMIPMKKRCDFVRLFVVVFWMAFATNAYAVWDGSTCDYTWYDDHSSPYLISSPEQLAGLAKIVKGDGKTAHDFTGETISLSANVDLGSYSWTPIGTNSCPFKGTFDGQSNTISRLYVSSSSDYSGLFGYSLDAQLHHVVIDAPSVTGTNYVGALVGLFSLSSSSASLGYEPYIYNCSVTGGNVSGSETNIGGLIGRVEGPGGGNSNYSDYHDVQIYNSTTSCSVTGTGSGKYLIAGLIGMLCTRSGATVYNCYTTGDVTVSNGANQVGGLIGYADNTVGTGDGTTAIAIHDCYSSGDINAGTSSGTDIGGLIGQFYEGGSNELHPYIRNCYATGDVTGYKNVGGLIGTISLQTANSSSLTRVDYCYSTGPVLGGNESSSGLGGILGYINRNGCSTANVALSYVAALNPSATYSGGSGVRRILGYCSNDYFPDLSNAYAFKDMQIGITSSPSTVSSDNAASWDGQDVNATATNIAVNWSGTWFASCIGWSFANSYLPTLAATTVNAQILMPSHLKVASTFTVSGSKKWSEVTSEWTYTPSSGTDLVVAGGELMVDQNSTLHSVTVNSGAQLTLNNDLTLSSGTFTLKSNANGTGTFVNKNTSGGLTVSGTTSVEQYLTGKTGESTTDNWWYVSTPVTGDSSAVFDALTGTNKFGYYNEASNSPGYVQITDNTTTLTPGTGYVVKLGGVAGSNATYTFSGTLNDGVIPITVTRTGPTAEKRGFNLIGNPYPSYLDWNALKAAATASSNVRPTIWYRTRTTGGAMTFDTYDGSIGTHNGLNETVSQYIPPMQAFWMKVDADASSATLTFSNNMRSHQDQSSATNRLRLSKASDFQIVRLKVSNGVNADEAIILADTKAADLFDYYDSQKMSNDNVNIPEIYTLAGTEELVINHLSNMNENKELTLGFRPGRASDFTLEATQISNLDSDLKVVLLDKLTNNEHELSVGNSYRFSSEATATNDRFSVLFKASSSVNHPVSDGNVVVYRNLNNRIMVICNDITNSTASVIVYNAVGQRLIEQNLTGSVTEIENVFVPGIYIVTLKNGGQNITKKISIN
jgi:hypothetical protein